MAERDMRHLLDRLDDWKVRLRPYAGHIDPPESIKSFVRKFHNALDIVDKFMPSEEQVESMMRVKNSVERDGGEQIMNKVTEAALDGLFSAVKKRFLDK